MDVFTCDFCGKSQDTLYEGWFRTAAAFNPYAAGTATAGVIQRCRVCRCCAQQAIATGQACATELPEGAQEGVVTDLYQQGGVYD